MTCRSEDGVGAGPGHGGRHTVDGLYVCYWSLMDPLCQTQSLAYLRGLAAQGRRFVLMTFEQDRFRLSKDAAAAARREMAAAGIEWRPLIYHKRHPLLATGYDCLRGAVVGAFLVWLHRIPVVHSRASIPAAVALALKLLCRVKFLYDADSRLSEEYADNGHWARGGRAFRITAWVEGQARRAAASIVTLSDRLRQDFREEFGVTAPIDVVPCCVDAERFRPDAAARAARRAELAVGAEKLFVYVGKLGPRYLVSNVMEFFRAAIDELGGGKLLVLSGDDPDGFRRLASEAGVDPARMTVRRAPHAEVPQWLSAADAGFALIRPAGCERGSSPIKIAEYLATGLPVVVTDGIGDASEVVAEDRVGVVLRRLDGAAYRAGLDDLRALWADPDGLRDRCRRTATTRYDLVAVGVARYAGIYNRLAGAR